MTRFMLLVTCALTCALLAVPATADDPPKELTPEERKDLETKLRDSMMAGVEAYQAGKVPDAIKATESSVEIARRLYPKAEYLDGHPNLAQCLNNLGIMYWEQGRGADAEPLWKDALAMNRRLFKGDHPMVAASLNNLANLYWSQGKLADAEPLRKEGLGMIKRLVNDKDHPDVAVCLTNLGSLYRDQGKLAAAEPLFKDALAMRKRLSKGRDHPDVAGGLLDLAGVYQKQEKPTDAEPLYKDSLAMYRRLFRDKDHRDLALCLCNFAVLYAEQGNPADAEPLHREALAMRRRLFKDKDHPDVATSLKNLGNLCVDQFKLAEAEALFKDALATRRRLYKDHTELAGSLHDLGTVYEQQGKWAGAEPLHREALAMRRRLFKDKDHPDVAASLSSLAALYQKQGKLADAEPLFMDALAMCKRLHKDGDHRDVAGGLGNLAALYQKQGKPDEAEPLHKEALDMSKRLFKGDHPAVAGSMRGLATFYLNQFKLAEAEPMFKDALAMYRRLSKVRDYPEVSYTLNNLALLYQLQGKWSDAEPLYKEVVARGKRLFQDRDHPDVANSLNNLATLYQAQGKLADAEATSRDALAMYRRMTVAYAKQKGEGETLTLIQAQPYTRDVYLSVARTRSADPAAAYDPATAYPIVWSAKGSVARVFEQRQLQARAAATDPALAATLARLADARRRRAELLLAPAAKDPGTLTQREAELKAYEDTIAALNSQLSSQLPAVARIDTLDAATLADLQKALPPAAAVVDFAWYQFFEFDNDKPVDETVKQTPSYLAFIVTKDKIAWVDLDTAAKIELAIASWREAITSGKDIPTALPAKVRELVWDKVRKQLPAGIKTVYVCPDAALCRVPWGALPGDKPGTILLEDFAVATIPHAPFLLDKLWPQDPLKNPPTGALVVGGVKYDADRAPPAPNAVATRGDPLVKPGAKLGWSFLPGTADEATGVFKVATAKKLPVTALKDEKATAAAVLAALPKAKYAHFATHGFFADPSFRSIFQLDEKDYEKSMRGERIGRAANSPLVMTGLVFAGANNPTTPGRGIVTGESLIDLDLSGLDLAVLSACETGLGDVAGGEGTFGLQRAFHLAGTRDVVASLWKVPDQSTAALMALFYRNLWEKNLSPMEALRQAQLAIYRDPAAIPALAKGFRGKFEEVPGAGGEADIKPGKDGKAHPLLWAAFTLSGPGR